MNRFLLLFVLLFGLIPWHASAATPKTPANTIVLNWSRSIDCFSNRAMFQFYVPYAYTDVDSCAVNLDDGLGWQGYLPNWTYSARYPTDGDKAIRIWIKKKDGSYDSLTTPINIVDTRVLFGFPPRDKFVSADAYPFTECAPTMENTVVSHRWEFQQRTFDGDCIEVKSPGMYIRQTTSANCDRYIRDTIYIKTEDYLKADFRIVDSSTVNCGVAYLESMSHGTGGIVDTKWVLNNNITSSQLVPPSFYLQEGPNQVKLIVTSQSGRKDSVEKIIFYESFLPDRVRLIEDSAIHVGDVFRVSYDRSKAFRPPYLMPPAKVEWSTGATTEEIDITEPGRYWVRVTPCSLNPSWTYSDTLVLDKFRMNIVERHDENSLTYIFGTQSNYYSPSTYRWVFSDNTTFTGDFGTHVFQRPGTYLVTVYREDSKGRRDSAQLSVVVTAPVLKAALTYQQEAGRIVRFTATSTGTPGKTPLYSWSFGDATGESGMNVSHTYAAAGKYWVTLTARDTATGMVDSVRRQITVWPDLDLGKDLVFRGMPIILRPNAPFYGDTSVHCFWQPGNLDMPELKVVGYGTYAAKVITADGFTTTDTLVVLKDNTPFSDFFNTGRSTDGKLTMIFAAGESVKYQGAAHWDFGDRSRIDTGLNLPHTYAAPGYYDVKMWRGLYPLDTARKRIYIAPPVRIDLGPDVVMPASQQLTLDGGQALLDSFYRTSNEVNWKWSTGATSRSITVTLPGAYSVTASAYGFSSTDTIMVLPTVGTNPEGTMNYYAAEGSATKIYFENTSQMPLLDSTIWLMGDGNMVKLGGVEKRKMSYSYQVPGTYEVTMLSKTSDGQLHQIKEQVKVWPELDLGPDTTFMGPTIALKLNAPYLNDPAVNCVWYPGIVSGHQLNVTAPGTYYAKVTTSHYTGVDTVHVKDGGVWDNFDFAQNNGRFLVRFVTYHFRGYRGPTHWSFGDGPVTDTSLVVDHQFPGPGTYTVKMWKGFDLKDTIYTITKQVTLLPLVTVDLGPDRRMKDSSGITLDAETAVDPVFKGDREISWKWSTGETSRVVTLKLPGVYSLTATRYGISSVDTIEVLPPLSNNPTGSMTYTSKPGDASKLYFENTSQITGLSDTRWSFGDGTGDYLTSSRTIEHTFAQAGTYTVTMQSQTNDGYRFTITEQVKVWPPLDLGPDVTYNGPTIELKVNDPYFYDPAVNVVWYPDVVSGKYLRVNKAGTYYAKVTAPHYEGVDTIHVLKGTFVDDFSYAVNTGNRLSYNFAPYVAPGDARTPYWLFGDGSPKDSGTFVTHVFPAYGDYRVKMWKGAGNGDTIIKIVKVMPVLVPDFSYTVNANTKEVTFTNVSQNMDEGQFRSEWEFGDGATGVLDGKSNLTITHRYAATGSYRVRMKVRDNIAGTGDTTKQITIAGLPLPPTAGFTAMRAIDGKYTMNFTNTSVVKTGNASAFWTFGDGTSAVSWNTAHTYAAPGSYLVKLLVTDSLGIRDSVINTVYIRPRISINLGPDTVLRDGQPILLEGYDAIGGAMNDIYWLWSTGDTTHRLQINTPGTYWLRATMYGQTVADTIVVTLPHVGPTAGFEAKRANDGLYTMNFTNTSIVKTGNASASWSFGDGTSAVSWNTAHTYAAPGSYLVKLLVTDSLGIRDSVINTAYIRPRISINLGPDTVLRNGQPILLEGYDAIGGAMNDIYWLWSTGDTTHQLFVSAPGTYWLRATMYGYTVSDTVIVKLPAALPPVVDSNAAVVQVKDSVPVTVTFPVARNADNVYTIQLANADNGPVPGARAEAPVVTDIVSFPSTSSRVSANVKLPDNLPCGKQYRIRVMSSSPAESSAWSQPFEVKNMPAIPLIAQRGDTLESSVAGAYQWYRNGLPVQGATSRAIRAKADGSYQVQVSAGGDCNAISAPLAMVITGLEEARLTASVLTVYPNPSSGAVYLQLEKQPAQPLLIHVYNTSGRIVHSLLMKDKQTVMDLGHMPKGLYYVQVSGREKQKPVLISIQ
ncbi:PKD domain-containing protein [Chitinophaga varians]|uniref:PKD domain-containing protein n=1 Tax=Chitinophaga varians TaxID=2202339 RepID=A0A847RRM2_9BACT|nr:PKD domain-containing protein [Chitinophaga varians]NLR63548.1 PKD domain-containing protein [Chitinophaga varians]